MLGSYFHTYNLFSIHICSLFQFPEKIYTIVERYVGSIWLILGNPTCDVAASNQLEPYGVLASRRQ